MDQLKELKQLSVSPQLAEQITVAVSGSTRQLIAWAITAVAEEIAGSLPESERDDAVMAIDDVSSPVISGILNALVVELWGFANPNTTPASITQKLAGALEAGFNAIAQGEKPGQRVTDHMTALRREMN